MRKSAVAALLVVASALSACEFAGSALAPSVTGRAPGAGQPAPIIPLDAAQLGTPSGTSVGLRIGQFRSDLVQLQQSAIAQLQRGAQLQADMEANISGYQAAVAAMTPGQQAGTADAPGTWQRAQAQLRALSTTLDQMNELSGAAAKNVAYAAYLLESIRAAGTAPDAVEEDHRQLQVLERSTAQTSQSLDRLLLGLRQDVLRQSHFLGTEGAKLAQMAPAGGVASTGISPAPAPQPLPQEPEARSVPQSAPPAGPAGAGLASGRPFVVIPFEDPAIQFEQQLYEAVSAALARSPNVAFDLVAVTPAGGAPEEAALNSEAAQANADRVMRSLLDMGLPADRISMTQMMDPSVQRNEVHLYVR